MAQNAVVKGNYFHGYADAAVTYKAARPAATTEIRHYIIQERELSYRFYPHFHPYTGQLVRRLLQTSTSGLQAADTDYVPGNLALPESIEVALDGTATLGIPAGSRVALLADVQATLAGGGPIQLTGEMELKLANAQSAVPVGGMTATLLGGMPITTPPGSRLTLPQDMSATCRDSTIRVPAGTTLLLPDGDQAVLPAVADVLLLRGSQFTIPTGTQVTLLRSKPKPVLYADIFSATDYNPSALVQRPYPVKDLDFTFSGAYSAYNWELFFHVPVTIAMHLSKNQRFAEAQRWFHYIFDPTDDSEGPTPERFWKVRPFQFTDVKKIEEILVNLSTGSDPTLRDDTIRSIEAWKDAPFRPHVVARYRQQAYMYKTVMAYLDNLIAWGDSLFRQDTGEAIDEAMIVYVLAANILGPRPLPVPRKGSVRPQTYANLRKDLDKFGNALRDMEPDLLFDTMPFPSDDGAGGERLATVRSLGKALYFCVPRNDKLLSYWDTVADRLFKIRNSLNLQGVFRQLALFEPPIDPAMLARAAAAGLDVGAIVNGLNQPLPLVRFQLLVQKAAEICQEVKSLGNNLLSAMEKEDGEAMAILRARHERAVLEQAEHVKYGQLQEAIKSKEGLLKTLAMAVHRYTYYERQLGKSAEDVQKAIPDLGELDQDGLEKMKFAMKEPEKSLRELEVDIAQDLNEAGGTVVSRYEVEEMVKLGEARDKQDAAALLDKIGGVLAIIPNFSGNIEPFGVGASISFGGSNLASMMTLWSSIDKTDAEKKTYESGKTAKVGTYSRREQDWAFQSNQAAAEITQIFKQLRAAQIREAIAEREWKNHKKQIVQAKEIEQFLNGEGTEKTGKRTNKALYAWTKREVKGLYGQCFQHAFDAARKAERALQHELGNPELSYLQFGYLAGKEGLLAGERLFLDIKRMETAFQELNQREYELTKHVSLLQVDPLALLRLRATGRCAIQLPEALFDMDGPGHYFRRIRSVAVSIPCITGPYAGVNCRLTLLKSSIRTTPLLSEGLYPRADAEDGRFSDYFGSLQSIVTSSGQNDSGLFEANLRDERYLPFEHSGVVSEWQLELPANPGRDDPTQFDYDTISDVILHIRYSAREGGDLLRRSALDNLKGAINAAQANGSVRLFSIRHEFPAEWARFKSAQLIAGTLAELSVTLREEHYPFWSRGRLTAVKGLEVIASTTGNTLDVSDTPDGTGNTDTLAKDPSLGPKCVAGRLTTVTIPTPTGKCTLFFNDNSMEDLYLAVAWGR